MTHRAKMIDGTVKGGIDLRHLYIIFLKGILCRKLKIQAVNMRNMMVCAVFVSTMWTVTAKKCNADITFLHSPDQTDRKVFKEYCALAKKHSEM